MFNVELEGAAGAGTGPGRRPGLHGPAEALPLSGLPAPLNTRRDPDHLVPLWRTEDSHLWSSCHQEGLKGPLGTLHLRGHHDARFPEEESQAPRDRACPRTGPEGRPARPPRPTALLRRCPERPHTLSGPHPDVKASAVWIHGVTWAGMPAEQTGPRGEATQSHVDPAPVPRTLSPPLATHGMFPAPMLESNLDSSCCDSAASGDADAKGPRKPPPTLRAFPLQVADSSPGCGVFHSSTPSSAPRGMPDTASP